MTGHYQFRFGEGTDDAFLRINRLNEPTTFETASGDTLHADAGDYLVVTADGPEVLTESQFAVRYPGGYDAGQD